MKLTCVAYLACAGLALAEGNDDLGLPQLDAPVPSPSAESPKTVTANPEETQPFLVVDDVVVPVDRSAARELIKTPAPSSQAPQSASTVPVTRSTPSTPPPAIAPPPTTVVTSSTTTAAPPVAPPAPVAPATSVAPPPTPTTAKPAPIQTATATYVYPNYSNYGAPTPDRAGPMMDTQRANDRTRRPDAANYRDDYTRQGRDYQRPPSKTRPGTDDVKPRDITQPRPNDYRFRDRTQQGPDALRPPDITRRRDR